MIRTALLACGCLTACTTSDPPTISIQVVQHGLSPGDPRSGTSDLLVELERDYDHTFAPVTATLNGVDLGDAAIHPGDPGITFSQAASPATASFTVPMASIGRGVSLDLAEGNEQFHVEVPDLVVPRAIELRTPVTSLRADGSIVVASGVATDELAGGFSVTHDGAFCFTQWGTTMSADAIAFQLPPTGSFECEHAPAPGSTLDVELEIELWSTTPVTRCDGPGLTCAPVSPDRVSTVVPATLQF